MEVFYSGLKDLEAEGIIEFVDDNHVRVVSKPDICMGGLKDYLYLLKRGVKHYITHGRSAKVKPIIVIEEAVSKIRRSMESFKMPGELANPESLLSLGESFFTVEDLSLDEVVKSIFGGGAKPIKMVRKGLLSELYKLYVEVDGGDRYIIVRKRYSPIYIFKWLCIQLWLIDVKRFILSSRGRLVNEFTMLRRLSSMNINCPRPLLVSWPDSSLYIEYISGKRLVDLHPENDKELILKVFYELGRFLGILHKSGLTIGDVKPHNIIVDGDRWFIVDLEQAREGSNYMWDVAEALLYSFIWTSRLCKVGIEDICESFLDGYMVDGDIETVRKAFSWRYIRPFIPLVPLNRVVKIRRAVKSFLISTTG